MEEKAKIDKNRIFVGYLVFCAYALLEKYLRGVAKKFFFRKISFFFYFVFFNRSNRTHGRINPSYLLHSLKPAEV